MQPSNDQTRPFRKFDKIPVVETDNGYVVDQDIVDEYFNALSNNNFSDYEPIKNALYDIVLTAEEIEDMVTNDVTPQRYADWKKMFKVYELNQRFRPSDDDEIVNTSTNQTERKTILNKNNPFAEVVIENSSFLYPTKSGYSVLSFNTNRHLIKQETEDGHFYAVVPGFKVSKSQQRINTTNIVASDSVSTPLPTKKDEKQIIYI